MSLVMPVLRAVVRDELAELRPIALAVVTAVATNDDGSGAHNVEISARLHGSDLELQRVPVAAGRIGLSAAPRQDDTAVVAFVGGELAGAVAIGFLHDDRRHPPKANPDDVVYEVPEEESEAKRLELALAGGNLVTVQDKKLAIVMGGTTVTVEADGAVTIEAAKDLTLKAGGKVTIEATKDLELKGANVTMKADTNATVEGGSAAKVKGSTTTIAGTTSFSMG
jgi:phage gp45-like